MGLKLCILRAGISKEHIYEIVFSGNTCMLHLASNTCPESLGKYPYTPKISGAAYLDAAKYNIDISPFGIIYFWHRGNFEGMNITCGMRAGEAAIEFFEIEEQGSINIKVIGETEAAGIKKNGQFIDPESENVLHPKLAERKRYKAGSACKGSCKGRN